MKPLKNLLALALFFLTLIYACSKSTSPAALPPTTTLQLNVLDTLGNPIVGASINLYSSLSDYTNSTNSIAHGVSGPNGTIYFHDLSPIVYYFSVKDECENNINGGNALASALAANVTTSVNVALKGTGTLKFVNTSSNPYSVYVNGALKGIANAGTTGTLGNQATGSYSIRVVQNIGYIVTPTDETFVGTLSCGNTLTTTFP